MTTDKKQYEVLPGVRHGKAREYGPGDIVELTDREAKPLIGFKVRLQTPSTIAELKAQEKDKNANTADPGDNPDEAEAAKLIEEAKAAKAVDTKKPAPTKDGKK